jgi:hypothetical protein
MLVLPISGRQAAAFAFLLILSTTIATAQTGSGAPTKIPSTEPQTTGSVPDARASVAGDAIRVPAFGTNQPTTMTLAEHKPRNRARIASRRIQVIDMPPPVYWRPLHYRFGYGYGPGLRLYRW